MPARSPIDPESASALRSGLPLLRRGIWLLLIPSIVQFLAGSGLYYGGLHWILTIMQIAGFGTVLMGLSRISEAMERITSQQTKTRAQPVMEPIAPAAPADARINPLSEFVPGTVGYIPDTEVKTIPAPKPPMAAQAVKSTRTQSTLKSAPAPTPVDAGPQIDWEAWVGQKLLQKVGIIIVLIGMAVFLKYSFDNNIIRELGRVVLSLIGSAILLGLGEWYRKRYEHWSQAFTGGGLALLYFTVWVAHVLYADAILQQHGFRIPAELALFFYSVITVLGASSALRHNAQTIGWFAVLGGYLTPILIPAPQLTAALLTSYLFVLTAGVLVLSWEKSWRGLTLAAFILTQLYLFGRVYPLSPAAISNPMHIGIAVLFSALFSASLAFAHFRVRAKTDELHVALALGNALLTFLGMLNPIGGIDAPGLWLLTLILGGVYLAFAAVALRIRPEDDLLIDVYHLVAIVFLAATLWLKLETEWVVAGLAPFSVLILMDAIRIRRQTLFGASAVVLALSMVILLLRMPVLGAPLSQDWQPFLSTWAILSYVSIASLAAWTWLSYRLPPELLRDQESLVTVRRILHTTIAAIAFLGVTFESTALEMLPTLPLTIGYLMFAAVAGVLFVLLREGIWLLAALAAQALVLLFIFFVGEDSSMAVRMIGTPLPVFQPWAIASATSLIITFLLRENALRVQDEAIPQKPLRSTLLAVLLSQLWLHGTVEIQHLSATLHWSTPVLQYVLSGWWLGLAAILLAWAIRTNRHGVLLGGTLLIWLSAFKDGSHILTGTLAFPSVIIWALILLGITVVADRTGKTELRTTAAILLPTLVAVDTLANFGTFSWVHTGWWVLVTAATLAYGFWRSNTVAVNTALCVAGIAFFHDVQLMPQHSALSPLGTVTTLFPATMFWTLIGIVLTAAASSMRNRNACVVGLGMIVSLCAVDMLTAFAQQATLLKTVWWAVAALGTMALGFAQKEKAVRSVAIGLFAATVIKLLFFDFSVLSTGVRIGASILTGLLLIGASYLYQRFEAAVVVSRTGGNPQS